MSHSIWLLVPALMLCVVTARAENPVIPSPDLIDQLLHMPAPSPPGGPQTRPSVPDENASVDDWVDYWIGSPSEFEQNPAKQKGLTDAIRQKLLQGGLKDPIYLPKLLNCLPETPEAADQIKRLYDDLAASPETTEDWKNDVHGWLAFHSRYFREDLLAAARGAKDDPAAKLLENEPPLQALAKLDWTTAYPLILQYERSDHQEVAAMAMVIRYEHAIAMNDVAAQGRNRCATGADGAGRQAKS